MATNEADTLFQLARRVRVLDRAAAGGAAPLNEPVLAAASRLTVKEGASVVPSVPEVRQHLQQELGWQPSLAETRRVLAAVDISPPTIDGEQ